MSVHHQAMFIRRTQTRNRNSGTPYVTYRLVHSARVGSSVKQSTLLNLGSHFDLPQGQWLALAARIDQLVRGQGSLVESTLSDAGQALAQRYAAQLIAIGHAQLEVPDQLALRQAARGQVLGRFGGGQQALVVVAHRLVQQHLVIGVERHRRRQGAHGAALDSALRRQTSS